MAISIDEIKEKLDALNVKYDPDATQVELIDLLTASLAQAPDNTKTGNTTTTPKTPAAALLGDENVVVKKAFLDDVMGRLEKLEKQNLTPEELAEEKKKPRKYTAKIRFINGQLVVGYGKTIEKMDTSRGTKRMYIEVMTVDGNSTLVDWIDFKEQGTFEEAEILEKKVKSNEISQGFVFKTEYDYNNYRGAKTEEEVPLIVSVPEITFKLQRPNGEIVELSSKAIN